MSVAGVRAGGAFVEILANDSKFQQAMTRVQNRVQAVGQTMQRLGTGMSLGGAALGAPLLLAGRQAAGFEDAILGMKAAAGLTDDEIAKLSEAARSLGSSMGISPTNLAKGFLELAKAGMSVQDILDGAGKSVAEFSKVSGVESERAAFFMKGAMSVFKVSATEAVDTLSAAADSSPASIDNLVESFSQVGSVGAEFGQSLFGISQALAVLADKTIVGEEAGTAVKTMLTKLIAPTDDAVEALAQLGLKMSDFRDNAGNLLPLQQIAGVFSQVQKQMGGDAFGKILSQKAITDVFEQRGIKVISAFANAGEEGFARVAKAMQESMPVSAKFTVMMEGINGQVSRLQAGVEQMSIAFGNAVSGPLKQTTDVLVRMMTVITQFIEKYPQVAVAAAGIAAGLVAIGAAAIAAGIAMRGFATVTAALSLLAGPQGWAAGIAIGAAIGIIAAEMENAAIAMENAEAKIAAAGKQPDAPKPGQNAVKVDENRDPMQGDPFAKKIAAEALAKEDADFEDAQTKALEKMQELSNSVVKEVSGLGDAAFEAGISFQKQIAEIMDKIKAGILNPEGAAVLADQAKAMFDADLAAVRKSLEEQSRDFGASLATFGNGFGQGIGPQLAKFVERAIGKPGIDGPGVNLAAMMGGKGKALMLDDVAQMRPGQQIAQRMAQANAGAAAAAANARVAGEVNNGMTAIVRAVESQVKVSQEGVVLLKGILNKPGRELVFQ